MIKKLNDVSPAVKRPMRVSDLQDVWDGLSNALASDTTSDSTGPYARIISGFYPKSDGNLSAGTVACSGNLYFHPDIDGFRIPLGSTVYTSEAASGDSRVFADGTTQMFSFNRLAVATSGGTSIGTFTQQFIDSNRVGGIPDGSLGTSKLADRSVTAEKLNFAPFICQAALTFNGTTWTLSDFTTTGMPVKRPISAAISAASNLRNGLIELTGVSYIASSTTYNQNNPTNDAIGVVTVASSSTLLPTAGLIFPDDPTPGTPYRVIIHGYQS